MRINQKVNFYSDDFKPPVVVLPAEKMLQYSAITLMFLVMVAVALYYPTLSASDELEALNARLADKKVELAATKKKYPKLIKSQRLDDHLMQLTQQNANKLKLLNYLKSDSLKEAQQFSRVFSDLKSFDNRSVWLTRIDLLSEGRTLKLTGLVSQPDVLPNYIDDLKQASSFKGRSFNLFNLERDADNTSYLHFVLSTESGGQNEG